MYESKSLGWFPPTKRLTIISFSSQKSSEFQPRQFSHCCSESRHDRFDFFPSRTNAPSHQLFVRSLLAEGESNVSRKNYNMNYRELYIMGYRSMTSGGTTKHRVHGEKTEAGSSSTNSGEYDGRGMDLRIRARGSRGYMSNERAGWCRCHHSVP